MTKYEITKIRSMDNEVRYVIYNKEEHAFFAGYDFMGSVDWEYSSVPSESCELTAEDDPEQIVKDLESADEPAEPEEPKMKLTRAQVETLNRMAHTNWEYAKGMLDGMNEILGTKYGWLGKEVVWFEEPDADTARKYAAAHSAIAWTEE